jgi:hypothetical protein
MAIFNSYVKLPEGKQKKTLELYELHHLWCFSGYVGRTMFLDYIMIWVLGLDWWVVND